MATQSNLSSRKWQFDLRLSDYPKPPMLVRSTFPLQGLLGFGLIVTADEQDISVCQSAYRLWEISTIGRFLSRQTANFLVRVFVLSKHNYYNSLHLNYPAHLHKHWKIQNSAACRVLRVKKKSNKQMDHVTPLLCSLHWLHVSARI